MEQHCEAGKHQYGLGSCQQPMHQLDLQQQITAKGSHNLQVQPGGNSSSNNMIRCLQKHTEL